MAVFDTKKVIKPSAGLAATVAEADLRGRVRGAIQDLEVWLGGVGGVPVCNLAPGLFGGEDPVTQVWRWVHQPTFLIEDWRRVTLALVRQLVAEEMETILWETGAERFANGHFPEATEWFDALIATVSFEEFTSLGVKSASIRAFAE
jgi:malate synthase